MKTSAKIKYFNRLAIFSALLFQLNIAQLPAGETINYTQKQLNSDSRHLQSVSLHSDSIQVESGWNLISLPLIVIDGAKSGLFPSAISDAFIYEGSYQPVETLKSCIGFWLKFDSSETIHFVGEPFNEYTITVRRGWNLIGAASSPAIADSIKSMPSNIIASEIYIYVPSLGYLSVDTLQPGSGYWIKANENGVLYLKSIETSCPGIPTVEYGGKIYNTVQIGDKCWLKENMNIGNMIQGSESQTDNDIIEKYCDDNNPGNCTAYGGLYQWDEAMQYATTLHSRGMCPIGWRIPTPSEFASLGADGNALKAIGQGSGDGAGTDKTGFSALLAGFRNTDGNFSSLGSYAYFWTDSLGGYADDRLYYHLAYNNNVVLYNYTDKARGFSIRCIKDPGMVNRPPDFPFNLYPADSATDIPTTVTLTWTCTDPDDDPLRYDIYFGTDNPPGTVVSYNQENTSLHLFDLTTGTTYYWKVIAWDNYFNSTSGPVWKFTTSESETSTPCPGLDTVYYEGKTYHTVLIGSQCWLRENLDVGIRIDSLQNSANNGTIEKYCYSSFSPNCDTYGGLYQWNEAMQYSTTPGTRGICPEGWHVPTYIEFQTLSTSVGASGNALKAIGQGSDGGAGTNTSGFSALLAGYRGGDGSFNLMYANTHFWSSTEDGLANAKLMGLVFSDNIIYLHGYYKDHGFSVRCLKD